VPSYRIPVLWENYLLRLRNAMAPPEAKGKPVKPRSKKKGGDVSAPENSI
jgi:hypothetical protein